jgi:hypothetical protein
LWIQDVLKGDAKLATDGSNKIDRDKIKKRLENMVIFAGNTSGALAEEIA